MSVVNRYRVYCQTESNYVYAWNQQLQTTCPNNNTHTIDSNATTIVESISSTATQITNLPLTSFDEVRTAERTRIIELKSIFGKSSLRDVYVETGTGVVVNNVGDSEYRLTVSGSNDVASLISAERGRYVAGLQGEVGVAARLPATLTGNQEIRLGLFDNSNGFYYKLTANGMNVAILNDGVETLIPRNQWNYDMMDGNGPSKLTLDWTKGLIFLVQFTWYGYGNINFKINTNSPSNQQNSWLIHTYSPNGSTSVKSPNLPIAITARNNGTTATTNVYVAGRQYSLLGKYEPILRIVSSYVFGKNINSTANFIPILSIRRKQGYVGNPVRAMQGDFIATTDQIVQVRVNTVLTGAAFTTPRDMVASDTAVECDTSATAITNGIPIWTGLVTGDQRGSAGNTLDIKYNLTEYEIMTICSKGVSTTNGTIGLVLRWTEEW